MIAMLIFLLLLPGFGHGAAALVPQEVRGAAAQESQPPAAAQDPLHRGEPVPNDAVAVIDGTPVPLETFVDEMLARHLRPGGTGHKVLDALVEEILIRRALQARGWTVEDEEVESKIRQIDEQCRKVEGKSLEETLQESKVPMEAFRKKTRGLVALERLARADLKIPADKPVETFHLKAWLTQARDGATVEQDRAKLPPGILATADGDPISKVVFVRELMLALEPTEVRRLVDTLLQEVLVMKLLASNSLELGEADVRAEYEHRKKEFEADPVHAGIGYEDIVKQQTQLTPAELMATRGFRVNAGLGLIARKLFTEAQVKEAYEKHQQIFGPKYHVRHVLVQASDHPKLQGRVRSPEEGLERMKHVLKELDQGIPFQDLAKLYSDDPASKIRGGSLPPFTPGRHDYEKSFADAAMALEVGEISEPVRTRAGWHLIRLDRLEPAPPLSEVETELRRLLAGELFKKSWEAAKIGVDVRL